MHRGVDPMTLPSAFLTGVLLMAPFGAFGSFLFSPFHFMSSRGNSSAHLWHIGESAARQRAFLTVGMTGAIANHMMKQMKKFNHAKWNARECGRANEKMGAICPETGCVKLPSSQ